jgi:phage FluMu protein Com
MEWNEFKCKICKKFYKTYKSLWNHNKNYHKNDNPQNPQKDEDISTLNCRHCDKILSRIDNLKRHEEKCKEKDNGKNKILELESKISEMFDNQKEMLKLIKIHPKINNIEI